MKKWLGILFAVLYLFIAATAWAQPKIPSPPTTSIYVQDYAGVLSSETKARINSVSEKLAAKTKAQVVVVTIKSLEGALLEDYSLTLLRQWGIGDKQLNNGVLLLVSTGDRKSRIEVGYGLEGALPDAKTGTIQDEYMLPYFKQGDYDKGVLNGYLEIVSQVAKEYNLEFQPGTKSAAPTKDTSAAAAFPWWAKVIGAIGLLAFLLFDWFVLGGFFTTLILSGLFGGRKGGGGPGGGSGGFGGGSGGGGGSSRNW